ncbi:outer membrane lipoprotein carrier protein LolA [uncultured Hyphomonas sp.]|uniref:LolA family protein n=1 Tax=uncultured Hyphomonas sp. TaxID=225298 RepID=UPI002AAA7C0E|nr:outer membrane lipoprotein carrier protein LolA [uncultured Hyphomonas sp.]
MKTKLAALVAAAALAGTPLALARQATPEAAPTQITAAPAGMTAAQRTALLKEIAASMEKVKTASGRFDQLAPDFTTSSGSFAISRPGKVRFDYDAPSPLLIVANGTTVAMQDSELETTDRVPLGSTPLAMLLDDDLDFETDAEIVDVSESGDETAVTLRDPDGEMDGTLTLLFKGADHDLTGWRTIDSAGNLTQVELHDVVTGKKINPRLFIVTDFDDE